MTENIGDASVAGGGVLAEEAFGLHLFHRPGHARPGKIQCIADIRDLNLPALLLQGLDHIQIRDIRRRHALGQRREQIPDALGQIAGIQQRFDRFRFP